MSSSEKVRYEIKAAPTISFSLLMVVWCLPLGLFSLWMSLTIQFRPNQVMAEKRLDKAKTLNGFAVFFGLILNTIAFIVLH